MKDDYCNEVRLKHNFFSNSTTKILLSKPRGSEIVITTLKLVLGAKKRIEGDKYFNDTLFTSCEDMAIIYEENEDVIRETIKILESLNLFSIGKEGYTIKRFWMKSDRNRSSKEYKDWRISVFKRDDYTCKYCGIKGGKLNAHHIKRWVDCEEKRYDTSNGETLCEKCHKQLHKNERKLKGGF